MASAKWPEFLDFTYPVAILRPFEDICLPYLPYITNTIFSLISAKFNRHFKDFMGKILKGRVFSLYDTNLYILDK